MRSKNRPQVRVTAAEMIKGLRDFPEFVLDAKPTMKMKLKGVDWSALVGALLAQHLANLGKGFGPRPGPRTVWDDQRKYELWLAVNESKLKTGKSISTTCANLRRRGPWSGVKDLRRRYYEAKDSPLVRQAETIARLSSK